MEISNQWKFKIDIKLMLQSETTPEVIILLCTSLIEQLTDLVSKIEKSNIVDDDKWYFESNLETIIDNFRFLKELADGTISESDWDNYSFNGNFENEFNGYFSELYDLADARVICKNDVQEKFLWVG